MSALREIVLRVVAVEVRFHLIHRANFVVEQKKKSTINLIHLQHPHSHAHWREALPLRFVRKIIPFKWCVAKASSHAYRRKAVCVPIGMNLFHRINNIRMYSLSTHVFDSFTVPQMLFGKRNTQSPQQNPHWRPAARLRNMPEELHPGHTIAIAHVQSHG